jgi:peroxiredoxin
LALKDRQHLKKHGMKKHTALTLLALFSVATIFAQIEKTVPSLDLVSIDGKKINLKTALAANKLSLVSFYAMWCNNCVTQYNSFSTKVNDLGIPVFAVSIDAKEQEAKVTPFLKEKNWHFSYLLDPEKQLFRAMGATFPPHLFLVNAEGKVLWEQRVFNEKSEAELLQKIIEFSGK